MYIRFPTAVLPEYDTWHSWPMWAEIGVHMMQKKQVQNDITSYLRRKQDTTNNTPPHPYHQPLYDCCGCLFFLLSMFLSFTFVPKATGAARRVGHLDEAQGQAELGHFATRELQPDAATGGRAPEISP